MSAPDDYDFVKLCQEWHDGQWSGFYKYQCIGEFENYDHAWDCECEARHNIKQAKARGYPELMEDIPALEAFEAYAEQWQLEYREAHLCQNCKGDGCEHCNDDGFHRD